MHLGKNKFKALREEMEQISGHLSLFVSRYRIFEEGGEGRRIVFAKELTVSRARNHLVRKEIRFVARVCYFPPVPANTPSESVWGKGEQNGECRRVVREVNGGEEEGGGQRGGSRSMNGSGMRAGYRTAYVSLS